MTPVTHTRSGHRYRHWLLAIASLLASLLVMALIMSRSAEADSAKAQAGADWQPVTVTYRSGSTIAQLEYMDARHWRKEIIEDRLHPEAVGSVMSFGDQTFRQTQRDTATAYEDTLTDGVAVPERWLHPGFDAVLQYKHYVASPGDAPNTIVYQQVFPTVPCPVQEVGHPRIPQPAACDHGNTYREVESWTFRTDITPPMVISGYNEIDGKIVSTVEVLSVEPVP